MNKKIRWITETAIMLALLVTLQALTKGFGQLVTGSCVNTILATAALVAGLGSGITVALDGVTLAPTTGYTYVQTSGAFATVPGVITVPAATSVQDPTTGEWIVTPGTAILTVSGTV